MDNDMKREIEFSASYLLCQYERADWNNLPKLNQEDGEGFQDGMYLVDVATGEVPTTFFDRYNPLFKD